MTIRRVRRRRERGERNRRRIRRLSSSPAPQAAPVRELAVRPVSER